MTEILVTGPAGDDVLDVLGDDRGLAYGDGLFETIRVRNGRPELLSAHCRRLLTGATRLGIPLVRADLERALDAGRDLIRSQAGDYRNAVLKLLLTRGSGGRGYRPPSNPRPRLLVSLHPAPPLPPRHGVAACLSDVPLTVSPLLAGLKSLNRLEQVVASSRMPDDCYEALMLGSQGTLVEGTRTSLLCRWDNHWLMPPLTEVAVAGVMVASVVERLLGLGARVDEAGLTPDQLGDSRFGGMVLLNSVIGAVPVRTLDGRQLPRSGHLATITTLAEQV